MKTWGITGGRLLAAAAAALAISQAANATVVTLAFQYNQGDPGTTGAVAGIGEITFPDWEHMIDTSPPVGWPSDPGAVPTFNSFASPPYSSIQLSFTVTGEGAGNGTFTRTDFDSYALVFGFTPTDLTHNLVTQGNVDLILNYLDPSAPTAIGYQTMAVSTGAHIHLTSLIQTANPGGGGGGGTNPTPEPASLALFAAGLGAMRWGKRRAV